MSSPLAAEPRRLGRRRHGPSGLQAGHWTVARTGNEGGVIGEWRWLADSTGIAFLERGLNGTHRLIVADLRNKRVESLMSETDEVKSFDIRDRQHYVYTMADRAAEEKRRTEHKTAAIVGTGRKLSELVLPDDPINAVVAPSSIHLWAVVDDKRFEVKKAGEPLASFGSYALSPDGRYLVTTLPVADVPSQWEALYPPPPFHS